jgi:hypothetical protein
VGGGGDGVATNTIPSFTKRKKEKKKNCDFQLGPE